MGRFIPSKTLYTKTPKKSILSPKWTRQRQQLEASSTRMESMIPQSMRPSTLLSLKRTSHAPSMRMSPRLLTERFTKITTTPPFNLSRTARFSQSNITTRWPALRLVTLSTATMSTPRSLAAEQAQFKNARTVGDTQHTSSANPTIAGEHVHHHVHENIQPVIQKETIQPSVVHTTVPVHEVHQNEAKHHTATSLPAVTMDEFKKQGGHLSGRDERTDAFAGEPRSVGGTLGGAGAHGTTSLTEKDG